MIEKINLCTDPKTAATPLLLQAVVSTRLGVDINRIKDIVIAKRSIDARQRQIKINLTLSVYIDEAPDCSPLTSPIEYHKVEGDTQAVVVGAGPAGLFAALRLIERGVRPIVLERGKDVDNRRFDMAKLSREGIVDTDSNYCFGEGGAGAFSDGKLYTRSKKRGSIDKILNIFCQHGASEDILVDAHPHIGTDKLPEVIKAIRQTIIDCGGRVMFNERVEEIVFEKTSGNGTQNKTVRAIGVKTKNGNEYYGKVIIATGHSARDTYRMLAESPVEIEPKGIAVGVRLEHPQRLIDSIQYHNPNGRGKYLPPAEYSMLTRVGDRAVYSFCMCPGGFIIPSASGPMQQAVNGMSPSNRGTRWANSGMVVEILPDDIPVEYGDSKLKVMHFQEAVERAFFEESKKTQNAPAQRMKDFVDARLSKDLPESSYAPGIHTARVDKLLPSFIAGRLQQGFVEFGRKSRGFLTNDATVIGCETRTSAPVRIIRDNESLESITVEGLFPAGEGAGYAGGIVSAAIDGERAADALADSMS